MIALVGSLLAAGNRPSDILAAAQEAVRKKENGDPFSGLKSPSYIWGSGFADLLGTSERMTDEEERKKQEEAFIHGTLSEQELLDEHPDADIKQLIRRRLKSLVHAFQPGAAHYYITRNFPTKEAVEDQLRDAFLYRKFITVEEFAAWMDDLDPEDNEDKDDESEQQ